MNKQGKNPFTAVIVAAVALITVAGCMDLDVQNPNVPDRERALATSADVESLIGSSWNNYWGPAQKYWPGNMLSVGADHSSSSWGNFGMKEFSQEPRQEFNNDPAWSYAFATEFAWYESYGGAVAASDGIRSMEAGVEIDEDARARAFAKFVQGSTMGFVASVFDQGFVVDETTDPEADQELLPYDQLMAAAITKLEEAATIAENNDFTLPDNWINGVEASSDQFARIIHSYIARFMANVARSPSEAQDIDWATVEAHIDAGITEDLMVAGTTSEGFWSGIKTLGGDYPVWSRVDLRQIGPADVSGAYQDWMSKAPANRTEFDIETPDARFPDAVDGEATDYFAYYGWIAHRPERGTYHFSNYGDNRYRDYADSCNFCWFGDIPEMTRTEMDLLKAEARLMQNDPDGAAALINNSRTANGELPAVTSGGVPEAADCVPRNADGECGSLMEALQYEKGVEVFQVSAGLPYFDDRRWGTLVSGTPVHLPVPGAELEVLQKEIYTFGGVGGSDAAPSIGPTEADMLRRVSYDLEALELMRERSRELLRASEH